MRSALNFDQGEGKTCKAVREDGKQAKATAPQEQIARGIRQHGNQTNTALLPKTAAVLLAEQLHAGMDVRRAEARTEIMCSMELKQMRPCRS